MKLIGVGSTSNRLTQKEGQLLVIENSFDGWIPVDSEYAVFAADEYLFHIFSPNPDPDKAYGLLQSFISQNSTKGDYILAWDTLLHRVAFLNTKGTIDLNEPCQGITLSTPIIIKSCGNTDSFDQVLTHDWKLYDAITFWGGNVNTIRNPKRATISIKERDKEDYYTGVNTINVKPFSEQTHRIPITIREERAEMVISSFSSDLDDHSIREIGYVDSIIRISFETPKQFNEVLKHFNIIKDLIALFTRHSNVKFETILQQRINEDLFFRTAVCKVKDGYVNHLEEFHRYVLQIDDVLRKENGTMILQNIVSMISKNEFQHIRRLLTDNNSKRNLITVNDIGFLCSALEVECNKSLKKSEKNNWIEGLKIEIKETITKYEKENPLSDTYSETNIGSCFQHLNYTLRHRIYDLYLLHKNILDQFTEQRELPQINFESIEKFVVLRNKLTHEGSTIWNGGEDLYLSLFYLTYASFFSRAGMSDKDIEELLEKLF